MGTKNNSIITVAEIKSIGQSKIRRINKRVGKLATSMQFAIMKHTNYKDEEIIIVVNRDGLLKYWGDAQQAAIYGKKNTHYKEFKTAIGASNYVNQ